ncbi:beta-phosphoglucomutase [Bacillus spongiae]|uniref:Beta-phosphoglucomutase n=1 Tax=Bacillus spongiae TaxID=2683610 RepID=A0ABU8HGN8_9BACI
MKTPKAVIFDLDGVIVDTVHYYYLSTKKVADEMGVPFTEVDNLRYQGKSRRSLMEELASRSNRSFTNKEIEVFGEKRNVYYQQYISELTDAAIFPGVISFIKDLVEENIKIGLASSSSNAERVLRQLDLTQYFNVIVNPKAIKQAKPDPEIFLTAAKKLNVEPDECVAIEDGEAGLTGILATDMFSIGVGSYPYLQQADWHIYSTKDLSWKELTERYQTKEDES